MAVKVQWTAYNSASRDASASCRMRVENSPHNPHMQVSAAIIIETTCVCNAPRMQCMRTRESRKTKNLQLTATLDRHDRQWSSVLGLGVSAERYLSAMDCGHGRATVCWLQRIGSGSCSNRRAFGRVNAELSRLPRGDSTLIKLWSQNRAPCFAYRRCGVVRLCYLAFG